MSGHEAAGRVQTVRGLVSPDELGPTMMHEHLLIDLRPLFQEPTDPAMRPLARAPMALANLSWVHRHWASSLDNLILDDEDLAVREAQMFKDAGGGTLVDVSSVGIRPDVLAIRRISERTGLHVVMGCGYYTAFFHPPGTKDKSEDEIRAEVVRDITDGMDGTTIRAGIIGEIGCSWPMHPDEMKALRASARASRETGVAITIHPGRHADSPFEILDILEFAGADPTRIVMGHMERTGLDHARLLDLACRGCYLEYDWFGEVRPTYPNGRVDVPSDGERIRTIAQIFEAGFGDQIVVAHDVCFKSRLWWYGGPGYGHILTYVTEWMRAMGIGEAPIRDILVHNPRRVLQIV